MKRIHFPAYLLLLAVLPFIACSNQDLTEQVVTVRPGQLTADHTVVSALWNGDIPESAVTRAVDTLHIGYGHTSHGSQLADGMNGLVGFANNGHLGGTAYSENLFQWGHSADDPGLHMFEGSGYGEGYLDHDCGYSGWDDKTRTYLDDHPECNVIIWSWCGQVGDFDQQGLIDHYLEPMSQLESEYPGVAFVYMTGHLDGAGEVTDENSAYRSNQQIRAYCRANNKWLYDFEDIESYDPDGVYYRDRLVNDGCYYDSDNDGSRDANWAQAWQNSHEEGADWYSCGSQHSEPLNANMKAYAAWWLWCRIAGWDT